MTHSELRNLNKLLRQELGECPLGPRFKWTLSSELYYFVDDGQGEQQTPAGVWAVFTKYTRKSFADRFGANVWLLAQWRAPELTRQQWTEQFMAGGGVHFAYPENGRYLPIDGTQLRLGEEPNEEYTLSAIHKIRKSLETPECVLLTKHTEEATKPKQERDAEWRELMNDNTPLAGHIPGMRDNVSFPTVAQKD